MCVDVAQGRGESSFACHILESLYYLLLNLACTVTRTGGKSGARGVLSSAFAVLHQVKDLIYLHVWFFLLHRVRKILLLDIKNGLIDLFCLLLRLLPLTKPSFCLYFFEIAVEVLLHSFDL